MKEKTKSGGYGALLSAVSEKKEIIVKSVVFAFAACLFGRAELLFETSPLGLAFVCAVREGIPFASLGLALGTLFADPLKTASTLSGLAVSLSFRYALSYVLRRSKGSLLSLNDGLAARIASAAAGGFTVSAIRVIYNGFRYYDLLAATFYMLCVCGGVFAYSAFLDAGSRGTERYGAGVAALIYSAVISLSGISMFGIRASALAAFTLTLIAGRRCGALFGVAAGFLCGAATELSLCPVYGSVGFLCGLLSHFSAYIGILFSLVSGLFIGLQTECFSTVDVLALDTLDGSAVFYKCGAYPSFIIRDGNVYGITSHTPPVGIMEKLSAEKIALKLKPDDTVVMVSDGVTGQTEDTESIVTTLRSAAGASPETVCDADLENAKTAHGLRDDMTVMAVKIKKA